MTSLPVRLVVVFHVDEPDRPGVHNDFKRQVIGRAAGPASADPFAFVAFQVRVEPREHHLGLGDHLPDGRHVGVLVKEHGVPFDSRNGHAQLVGVNQEFEQFGHDVPAVQQFGFVHKPGEPADVGDEKQRRLVAHGTSGRGTKVHRKNEPLCRAHDIWGLRRPLPL
jgi:hypothetical protein